MKKTLKLTLALLSFALLLVVFTIAASASINDIPGLVVDTDLIDNGPGKTVDINQFNLDDLKVPNMQKPMLDLNILPTHGNSENQQVDEINENNNDSENTLVVIKPPKNDELTLDLSDGDIYIYPNGYKQAEPKSGAADVDSLPLIEHTGKYVITGTLVSDTPLRIINMTGESAVFDIIFDNANIIADIWCAAASITANADTVVNIENRGCGTVAGYNHPAFAGNTDGGAKITVNIFNAENSSLLLSRQYSDVCKAGFGCSCIEHRVIEHPTRSRGCYIPAALPENTVANDSVAFNENIEMFINGEAASSDRVLKTTEAYEAPQTQSDGGAQLCKYCDKDHSSSIGGALVAFLHSIMHFFNNLFK